MNRQDKQYKRGQEREDGMVFWQRNRTKSGEWYNHWVTKEDYVIMLTKAREKVRRWHQHNKDRSKQLLKKWLKSNPDRAAAFNSEKAARFRSVSKVTNQIEDTRLIRVLYETSKRISRCLGSWFHVDHKIPLSKGGLHCISNLQIIPGSVNLKKGSKLI